MKRFILTTAIFLTGVAARAEVTCPPVFSDHMVLQCDIPLIVWGSADPGEEVTVRFEDQDITTSASSEGKWRVIMNPLQANAAPGELSVSGSNSLIYKDVLVGEVWLCSGQSNMEKPIGEQPGQKPTLDHEKEIASANHPDIRLFKMPKHGKSENPPVWAICSPDSVEDFKFSAVGYFFGTVLEKEIDRPIGLIESAYGGTMIEAWIPRSAYLNNKSLLPLLDQEYFAWVDGVQATELYASMIAPLRPFGLRGFLWYQGESNLMNGDSDNYTEKQIALIESWREKWNLPEAPFYFVQLAPFNYSDWTKFPERQTPLSLPAFWEAQSAAASHCFTDMIVITDLAGDATDIHPIRKKEVGLRLANMALKETYGRTDLDANSPEFVDGKSVGEGNFLLCLNHVGQGLESRDGKPLTHFQVAGEKGHFHPATATIIPPDKILVHSDKVEHPFAVRFGWDEQATPNLVNSEGLPAAPFRTDSWPVQTVRFRSDTSATNK